MDLPKDLKEFLESLNSKKAEYVIVGGYAQAFHGRPRFTGDIDVLVRPSAENAARIKAAIDQSGFRQLGLEQNDFVSEGQVIQLGVAPNRVDILHRSPAAGSTMSGTAESQPFWRCASAHNRQGAVREEQTSYRTTAGSG